MIITNANNSDFLRIFAIFFEIKLLLGEARIEALSFSQILASKQVFIALALLSATVTKELIQVIKSWLLMILGIAIYMFLVIEFLLNFPKPLTALKKRATFYCKKWRSGRDLSLPLICTYVYGQTVVRFSLVATFFIGDMILYLVGMSASFSVRKFLVGLYQTISEDRILVIIYVVSSIYFEFSP